MAGRSAIQETFRVERTYPAAPPRVFAAFSTEEARSSWGDTDAPKPPHEDEDDTNSEISKFEFRTGGRESFSTREQGTTYRYDGRYYDIVPDNRIVYSYEMYADGTRISVSLATIEFVGSGRGTRLIWTEQGVYLDGYNGVEAAAMRKDGQSTCSTAWPPSCSVRQRPEQPPTERPEDRVRHPGARQPASDPRPH